MKSNNNTIVLIALYDRECIAIRTFHSILRNAGFNVQSIYFKHFNINATFTRPTEHELQTIVKVVKDLNPFLVGISLRSTLYNLGCEITRRIKNEIDTVVAFGGIHPTIRPEQCIQVADVVCVGDGEDPLLELATKLSKGEDIDNIQNLWIKKGDKITRNPIRSLVGELDSYPYPDFTNDDKWYIDGGLIPGYHPDGVVDYFLMSSRGCPYRCTYCCNNTLTKIFKGNGKYLRRRSVENTIGELVLAKKMFKNLKKVHFYDDVFSFDLNWIRDFSKRYKEDVRLPFFFEAYPKSTKDETIRLLKEAGADDIVMGVQSGSEEIRSKYYERYDTNEEIVEAAQILHKYKLHPIFDIIMDNPLETEVHKRETFNLLLRLPRPFRVHTFALTHFPESGLTNTLLTLGFIKPEDVEDVKEAAYDRYILSLDLARNKDNLFWDNMYYLTQKRFLPRQLLRAVSHMKFLRNHPASLTWAIKSLSFNVLTVNTDSKFERIRWFFAFNFMRLFNKLAWEHLWIKIKQRVALAR